MKTVFSNISMSTKWRPRFVDVKTGQLFVKIDEMYAWLDYMRHEYQKRDDSDVYFRPDAEVLIHPCLDKSVNNVAKEPVCNPEIERYSHFEYHVVSRECSGPFCTEKRCDNAAEAIKYVEDFGEQDYRGRYHGQKMRAVEIEKIFVTRLLKENK